MNIDTRETISMFLISPYWLRIRRRSTWEAVTGRFPTKIDVRGPVGDISAERPNEREPWSWEKGEPLLCNSSGRGGCSNRKSGFSLNACIGLQQMGLQILLGAFSPSARLGSLGRKQTQPRRPLEDGKESLQRHRVCTLSRDRRNP